MQTDEPVASTSTADEEVPKERDVVLSTPRTTRRSTRMLKVSSPVQPPEAEAKDMQATGDESFAVSMSLDVLAQVATETLEKEPVSKSKVLLNLQSNQNDFLRMLFPSKENDKGGIF